MKISYRYFPLIPSTFEAALTRVPNILGTCPTDSRIRDLLRIKTSDFEKFPKSDDLFEYFVVECDYPKPWIDTGNYSRTQL